jgi:hypothetical protein
MNPLLSHHKYYVLSTNILRHNMFQESHLPHVVKGMSFFNQLMYDDMLMIIFHTFILQKKVLPQLGSLTRGFL